MDRDHQRALSGGMRPNCDRSLGSGGRSQYAVRDHQLRHPADRHISCCSIHKHGGLSGQLFDQQHGHQPADTSGRYGAHAGFGLRGRFVLVPVHGCWHHRRSRAAFRLRLGPLPDLPRWDIPEIGRRQRDRLGTIVVQNSSYAVLQKAKQCSFTLSPASASVAAAGGPSSFGINNGNSCNWSAATTNSWLHTTSSGSGGGTVSYTVDANNTIVPRSGTVTAGNQTFTVNQAGAACSYSLSANSASYSAAATNDSVTMTTLSGCPWTASTTNVWLHPLSVVIVTLSLV